MTIGMCWTPVSSSILSSSDPPLQATPCFSKTPLRPLFSLVQSPKCLWHSNLPWNPEQWFSPRPKTPQIKQKKGSHSIWKQEQNLKWKTFIPISTNLKTKPIFQAVLREDLKARVHSSKRSDLMVEMEISSSSSVVSWRCWDPPMIAWSMLLKGFNQTFVGYWDLERPVWEEGERKSFKYIYIYMLYVWDPKIYENQSPNISSQHLQSHN